MSDNVTISQGVGTTMAADDVGGVMVPRAKLTWGADGTANDADIASGKALPVQIRDSVGTELIVGNYIARVSTTITRPTDTTTYAADECFSAGTPAVGGSTLTSAVRASGGSGIILSLTVLMSTAATLGLQGEIWFFNQAVTNTADNSALSVSDADMVNFVGKVAFVCNDTAAVNKSATVTNINLPFICVGTANLRFVVKVLNAYVPANAEVMTVTATILQTS